MPDRRKLSLEDIEAEWLHIWRESSTQGQVARFVEQGNVHVSSLCRCFGFTAANRVRQIRALEALERDETPLPMNFGVNGDWRMTKGSISHVGMQELWVKFGRLQWITEALALDEANSVVGSADFLSYGNETWFPTVGDEKTGLTWPGKKPDPATDLQVNIYREILLPDEPVVSMFELQDKHGIEEQKNRFGKTYKQSVDYPPVFREIPWIDVDVAALVRAFWPAVDAYEAEESPPDPRPTGGWECRAKFCRNEFCPHRREG